MKLRITQKGWAGFTGHYGIVEFKDGVSIDHVSPIIAQRLAALIAVETVPEDGSAPTNPSITQVILDGAKKPADPKAEPPKLTTDAGVGVHERGKEGKPYTRAELEKIASEKGINGLRDLAEPAGIKGTKIVALIEAILKAGVVNPASVDVRGDDKTKEAGANPAEVKVAPSVAPSVAPAPKAAE